MAFKIKYSRLFECRFRHGYYLHPADEGNFYSLDDLTDAELIQNLLRYFDLSKVITIQPLLNTRKLMAGHRMKMAQTPHGFFVGLSVEEQAGTPAFYRPKIAPSEDLRLYFGIRAEASAWAYATEERMAPNVPAIYYFSNLTDDLADAASSLSRTPLGKEARSYEMGEYIWDGTDLYRAVIRDDAGANLSDTTYWEQLTDNFFEASDNDRQLLSDRFTYRFTPQASQLVDSATIELVDLSGTVVATDSFNDPNGLSIVSLDYSDVASGWYDLEVSGADGYTTTKRILINKELYDPQLWGVIAIGHEAGLSFEQRLLEADGTLRHTATETVAPVFELRIPNRYSFWRYVAHPTQTLAPAPGAEVEVFAPEPSKLVTKVRLPMKKYGTKVEYRDLTNPTSPIFLPNPSVQSVIPLPDGKIYSDVYLGVLNF